MSLRKYIIAMLLPLFGALSSANAQSAIKARSWSFDGPHGKIVYSIKAGHYEGGDYESIYIDAGDEANLTDDEMANQLSLIFSDIALSKNGNNKIKFISTWLQNSDYSKGVSQSVTNAKLWGYCNRRKYCHKAEAVANSYLQSVAAYKSLNKVLDKYNMKVSSVRVDNMAVGGDAANVQCYGMMLILLENPSPEKGAE